MPQMVENSQLCLTGRHFICKIKCSDGAKRKTPVCRCHWCNFSQEQLAHHSLPPHKLTLKFSCFGYSQCEKCYILHYTML